MSTEYHLPPLPLGGPEAVVVRWLRQPGELVTKGAPLLVVVNDRVEVALPAPDDGVLERVCVAEGALAPGGALLAQLGPLMPAHPAAVPQTAPQASGQPERAAAVRRRVSPVALRIARSAAIDLQSIAGSGPGGRVLKRDVLAAVSGHPLPLGEAQPPGAGTRRVNQELKIEDRRSKIVDRAPSSILHPLSSIFFTTPFALTAMEVDMGRVAAVRADLSAGFAHRGLALTDAACLALIVVETLLRHPLLNSTWDDDGIILRRRVHLAVVAPGERPMTIVRDAQDLNLRGIARALDPARMAARRSSEPDDATFTLADLNDGPWLGTPIPLLSHSAALGMSAARPRPLVISDHGVDRLAVRPTTVLSLTYDARVLDQCHADAFLRQVKGALERFNP